MIIRVNSASLPTLAYGPPRLAWTAGARAYFHIDKALTENGTPIEISVDISELESMVAAAKKGKAP